MGTCLFTGNSLDQTTQDEHTIPRKLGGRICSKVVSSNDFNNRCGSTIDQDIVATYWQLMSLLAPLLSKKHRPGKCKVELPDSQESYFVDSEGVLNAEGFTITARDPETGHPTGVAAKDMEAVLKLLEANNPGASIKSSFEVPPKGRAKPSQSQLLGPNLELAVLKSGLLTFDALLDEDQNRFTRSKPLHEIRNTVRDAVMKGASTKSLLNLVSLGIQYEKVDLYRELREQLDFPHSDFEHVLFASANVATRTLDLIVWLYETDPYGFRLTTNWHEEGFTYCIVNGVLSGTGFSKAIELPSTHLLCRKTLRRCTQSETIDESEIITAQQEIMDMRFEAIRRAQYKVLMECDEYVIKSLSNAALPHGDKCINVGKAVRSQLVLLYEQRLEDKSRLDQFNKIIDKHFTKLPESIKDESASNEDDLGRLSWDTWLDVFRSILNDLCDVLGLPGDGEMKVSHAQLVE